MDYIGRVDADTRSVDCSSASPDRVVSIARNWLGTPYHHQASVRLVGADCLGLVRGVWRELYGREAAQMPAYASDWAEATGQETLLEAAQAHLKARAQTSDTVRGQLSCSVGAGDVVVFRHQPGLVAKHIGIATSTEHFIHAIEGRVACEVRLGRWWARRIAGVFQFP